MALKVYKMSEDQFHYFPRLPKEIRELIWECCLPNRIAEYDGPWHLLDGFRVRQACHPKSSMRENSRLPAIAAVNFESRQVVMRSGTWMKIEDQGAPWLKSIWVQPRIDVLHLNWVRHCWMVEAHSFGNRSWFEVESFVCKVSELGMGQLSITADVIHPFRLDMLADDYHNYVSPNSLDLEVPSSPDDEDVADFASLAGRAEEIPRVLHVAMAAVSLHVSREAASKSGLFGLLGDAPVQMVDVNDNARLERFETFYNNNAIEKEKEPKVQILFDLFKTSQFRDAVALWKEIAESMLLSEYWHWAQEWYEISVKEPEEDHPFMEKAQKTTFKLRPQIMIRHCDHECYIKGRLPENFGQSCSTQ